MRSLDNIPNYQRRDRLHADTVNALVRAAKAEINPEFGFYDVDGSAAADKRYDTDWIPYKNSTGDTIPPGAIFWSNAETTDIHLQISAEKPATIWKWVWYVNSLRPVGVGKTGWCSIAAEPVWLYTTGVITPGMFVGPQHDSFIGIGNRNGFRCVGKTRTIATLQMTPCIQVYSEQFFGKPIDDYDLDANDGEVDLWDAAFVAKIDFKLSNVRVRTRALTTTDRVSGNVVGGIVSMFPIDCPPET